MRRRLIALCLGFATFWTGLARADDASPVDFTRDIRPILSNTCYPCHGPDPAHRRARLRFDVEESAKAERRSGAAIRPGDSAGSSLVHRILSSDPSEVMPPPSAAKELSSSQVELLRRWIDEGASWSVAWAYEEPRAHVPPEVRDEAWPVHWVDRYVLDVLEAKGLTPSADADPVTLIRRLSFDLTGLPPTLSEVDAYAAAPTEESYRALVDRWIDSDHYGERMAQYWLDLVRFADTVGYHGDQDHNVSPYRDYVIDSFARNVPFDRFTHEQLAGDLLPDSGPDQQIATAYNRLLQTSHEGGVQAKEYLAIYAADRVRSVSGVWMGATLGCAQCHDHKYDPFTAREFYSMAAFFADVDEASHLSNGTNALPTRRDPEVPLPTRRERAQMAALEETIRRLEAEAADSAVSAEVPDGSLVRARAKLEELQAAVRKVMVTRAVEPRDIRILPRGDWLDDSGPVVLPAVPSFMSPIADPGRRLNRLDLARWLTNEDGVGGLTARVFVNRLWSLFFGEGLSRSLDDFGGQGEPPSHPELLDALAVEFVNSGWDVKHMVRLLVTSRAYRQSSLVSALHQEKDPENRAFGRQARPRFSAETIRDNALAASGLLVRTVGGPSVKPYQPPGYYQHLNFPTRKYQHDVDEQQWRRGIYVHWQRQFLHPMLRAFDAPNREECTAQRARSNTPIASLTLLNDPTFVEAARGLAERMLREGGASADERLTFGFRLATSRFPDDVELAQLRRFLDANLDDYTLDPDAAASCLTIGQREVAREFDAIEPAAWAAVGRLLFNLHETITRN